MVAPTSSPSSHPIRPVAATPPAGADDWTVQAVDTIDSVVGLVRDKATIPIRTVARGIVYGLTLGFVGIAAVVLLIAGAVRLLVAYVPVGHGPDNLRRVWIVYGALGIITTVAGLVLLRKAESSGRRHETAP